MSVGVQSLNPRHLGALGRIHDAQQARDAIETAQACFENINVDLMYALPDQTLDDALWALVEREQVAGAAAYAKAADKQRFKACWRRAVMFTTKPRRLPRPVSNAAIT